MNNNESISMEWHRLDEFTTSYVETALWSSRDNQNRPMEDYYDWSDFSEETKKKIIEDCKSFQESNSEDIAEDLDRAGHDFWLTRNRHGAGFWDGDWSEEAGKRLTESAHAYGSCDLIVGDDNFIYI